MSDRRAVNVPPRRRPVEIPAVRITKFSYDDKSWPHPGESDNGPILRLFTEMGEWFPAALRDGDGFRAPGPEELHELVLKSGSDLQVAIEQYVTGLERGRKWSDRRMQRVYKAYRDRSLTNEEMAYVVAYAIGEHGI